MSTGGKETNRQNREKEDFSFLQSLTDEELDDLLDAAAAEEDSDENSVLIEAILDEWKRREEGSPENLPDAAKIEASLARCKVRIEAEGLFGTNGKPSFSPDPSAIQSPGQSQSLNVNISPISASGQNKRRTHQKIFAIAACLVFVLVISFGFSINASADGYGFWDKLVVWTKETFHFSDGQMSGDTERMKDNPKVAGNPMFANLEKTLKENGIDISLPTWIPEGYEAKKVDVNDNGATKVVTGWFGKDADWFSVEIIVANGHEAWTQRNYEENQGKNQIYVFANVEHYITVNEMDGVMRYNVVWQQGEYTVKLQGNLLNEEIKTMINSVYERV